MLQAVLILRLVMVGFRLYWVDSSLPGVRSIPLDGSEDRVNPSSIMMRMPMETFLDITVYHVTHTHTLSARLICPLPFRSIL